MPARPSETDRGVEGLPYASLTEAVDRLGVEGVVRALLLGQPPRPQTSAPDGAMSGGSRRGSRLVRGSAGAPRRARSS